MEKETVEVETEEMVEVERRPIKDFFLQIFYRNNLF